MYPRRLPTMTLALVAILTFAVLLAPGQGRAQASDPAAGWENPVIEGYGHVWPLPDAPFQPQKGRTYKVVANVTAMPADPSDPVGGFTHTARLINLWAMSGMPIPGSLDLVVIAHGPATTAIMNDKIYRQKYGTANPNLKLIDALVAKGGAKIYVCGQAMHDFGYSTDDMASHVVEALSALAVLIGTESNGYALLQF
jgi:intracellular sulfur oxidation DsrE/DsrF family protein